MKRLLFIFILIITGCEKESGNPISQTAETNEKFVVAQIDLQIGFAGNFVHVKCNGTEYFQADLSKLSPLAGPEASLSTCLPRGQNVLYIYGRNNENRDETFEYITNFQLGENEKYYIGVVVGNNSIRVQVQDSIFNYD